jgi:hypothetical protein
MSNSDKTRRGFLKKAGLVSAGMTIIPSKVMSGFGHKAPVINLILQALGLEVKVIQTFMECN